MKPVNIGRNWSVREDVDDNLQGHCSCRGCRFNSYHVKWLTTVYNSSPGGLESLFWSPLSQHLPPTPTYTHTIWELREYFFLLDKLELLVLLVFIIHRHDHNQRSFYKSYIFSLVLQVTKLNFPTTSKSIISSFNWVEIPWTEYTVWKRNKN